jgi:leucyl-tRNA synthetase
MYNHKKIESKWKKYWEREKICSPDLDKASRPFYNLMMFPYPSAEGLHMGNMYAFTHSDCFGRYKRLKGYTVFEPIGLDGFGIHSENYALKIGEHIKDVSARTEKNFYKQLKMIGGCFDWDKTVETYRKEYYCWTQWLFIQLYKKGLAYRKKFPVNWCPGCKTVLSDEQIIAGRCERCDNKVEKREMEQWFFKITAYAERLLKNLAWIDWSPEVKIGQKNWIGKSEGAEINFCLKDTEKKLTVFTTRPDTIFGATYLVIAPEHNLLQNKKIKIKNRKEVEKYVEQALRKNEEDRIKGNKQKTGVEIKGLKAINPLTKKNISIWVADYVLMDYGYGAIMAVPAHDKRDFEFAKKFKLPIKKVIQPITKNKKKFPQYECFEGEGTNLNSGFLNGLKTKAAQQKIIKYLEQDKIGKKRINYKLRDWCISRQRYWGPPIPMVKCKKCGWVPVSEKDLPVVLPPMNDFKPDGSGKGPLNKLKNFVETRCPKCGGKAERETDVSDPFVDSSWYFFRYLNSKDNGKALDKKRIKKWMPIDMYIGGKEHTVLHLLYSRFITMFLHDLGYCDFEEPFRRFFGHGLVIKDGAKMSKSKGNIVNPDDYIERFGADSVRLYLMFLSDIRQGGEWKDEGIIGMFRFVKRIWAIFEEFEDALKSKESLIQKGKISAIPKLHKTIKKVTEDLERLSFNTAIASIMELINWYYVSQNSLKNQEKYFLLSNLAIIISPFAPHLGEEFWSMLGNQGSIFKEKWPEYNKDLVKDKEVEMVIQINGKLRGRIRVPANISQEEAFSLAVGDKKVKKFLGKSKVKKKIFIKGKLVNLVV